MEKKPLQETKEILDNQVEAILLNLDRKKASDAKVKAAAVRLMLLVIALMLVLSVIGALK